MGVRVHGIAGSSLVMPRWFIKVGHLPPGGLAGVIVERHLESGQGPQQMRISRPTPWMMYKQVQMASRVKYSYERGRIGRILGTVLTCPIALQVPPAPFAHVSLRVRPEMLSSPSQSGLLSCLFPGRAGPPAAQCILYAPVPGVR